MTQRKLQSHRRNSKGVRLKGSKKRHPFYSRRGFLLLAVLLVIAAIALSALAFTQSMLIGNEESVLAGEAMQARFAADSGIDSARLFLASSRQEREEAGGTYSNPNNFQAIPVLTGRRALDVCNYTLIASDMAEDGTFSGVRFGLQNESARLNLNVLPIIDSMMSLDQIVQQLAGGGGASSAMAGMVAGGGGGGPTGGTGIVGAGGGSSSSSGAPSSGAPSGGAPSGGSSSGGSSSGGGTGGSSGGASSGGASSGASGASSASGGAGVGRSLLMALPGMTEDTADSILDFIDEDDESREYGAERDYYTQLPTPYAPVNGPLQSIEQLLLVRGVTPQLLFGNDQNRNGVLEDSESSAAVNGTSATAIANGGATSLSAEQTEPPALGWAHYLTLYSKERNLGADGTARININNPDLATLQQDLASAVGDDLATFIIAYRVNSGGGQGAGQSGGATAGGGGTGGGGGQPGGGGGGGGRPGADSRPGQGGPGGRPGADGRPGGGTGGGGPGAGGGRPGQGGGGPGGNPGAQGTRGGGQGGGGGNSGRGGRSNFELSMLQLQPLSMVALLQPPRGGQGNGPGGGQGAGGAGGPGRGGPGGGAGQGGQGGGGGGGGGGPGGPGRTGRDGQGRDGQGRGGPGGGGPGGGGPGGGGPGGGGMGGTGGVPGGQAAQKTQAWSAGEFSKLNIDTSQEAAGNIRQVLDLIGAQFTATVNNEQITYTSPLTNSPIAMATYLPNIMDKLTAVDATVLPGRININEAPREILAGLPGMTPEILDKLIEARSQSADNSNRRFETWPMVEGILSLQQMQIMAPLVTGGGDVMRAQSIGYFEISSGFARTEAVIDASGPVPTVLLYRKMDHLGRGFSQSTLGQRAQGLVTTQ